MNSKIASFAVSVLALLAVGVVPAAAVDGANAMDDNPPNERCADFYNALKEGRQYGAAVPDYRNKVYEAHGNPKLDSSEAKEASKEIAACEAWINTH